MIFKRKERLFRKTRGWFLFSKVVFLYLRLFYKQIVVEGKELIPQKGPVIFAPNHQNALMDPLVLHFAARMQTIFLARSDIFRIPVLKDFFYWLKMLPVFRIRDGIENLQNNDESFNIAVEVLEHGQSVGIFPEATHNNLRRLLPLKKGVARLAFLAEAKNGFALGLNIVPVGIHYSNYEKMHSTVHIRFGEAIHVARYREEFEQNHQKAMLHLRDDMTKSISKLAIDIRNSQSYETIYKASELLALPLIRTNPSMKSGPEERFKIQQSITKVLENEVALDTMPEGTLLEKAEELIRLIDLAKIRSLDLGIKPGILMLSGLKIVYAMLLPVYVYGAVNGIPKSFLLQLLLKKFKDRQFHSSIKFVWGMAVAPLIFLVQGILVWVFTGSALWAFGYLISLPFAVVFSKMYLIWIEKFISALRLVHLRLFNPQYFNQLYRAVYVVLEGLSKGRK